MRNPLLDLKRELLILQQKGRKLLAIEKLLQYCDIAEDYSTVGARSEAEDRDYRHRMDVWRVEVESGRLSTQLVNDSAFQTLKTLVLIAGGSSAAVLAFLGAVWSSVTPAVRVGLAAGLGYFGSAVIGAAFAYGLSYLTLLSFFEYEAQKTGNLLRILTIILVVACYVAMGLGLLECYKAITT
jgi:hypothetical protein